jgi:hypothetical protein
MAKDFFGNEIKIGDTVAFMQIGYRRLKNGVIKKITEKMVFIEHERFNVGGTETKQEHNQVIVKK